jgi:glycosyltransferase involved in cell wall biosynthesis
MTQGGLAAILWAPYEKRTTYFARRLGATLYNVHYLRYKRPLYAPFKYPPQCLKTWGILARQRPTAVYVMNPPVFAALSVYVYCRLARAHMVMDTHPPALFSRKWGWSAPLQRGLARRAFMNVVDQERFRQLFTAWGARAVVLSDPPVSLSAAAPVGAPDPDPDFSITVINTFAPDEPLAPILAAAQRLPDVRFFILGDVSRAGKNLRHAAPGNVVFTGYLLGDAYWRQLLASHCVMALTTYPHSLLGGAQEGMAAGKPLLLSRQPALTEFFSKGAIFVDHSADSIVQGIDQVRSHAPRLAADMAQLALEKQQAWEIAFQELLALLGRAPQLGQSQDASTSS